MKKSFTLVELLIVVSILGILAAIVVPTFQSHIQLAKESAAKDNLRILRNAIELYTSQHNDAPPGYPMADTSLEPVYVWFLFQMRTVTNVYGQIVPIGTPGYGPYLLDMPKNPYNDEDSVMILQNSASFPQQPSGTSGWIYHAATKTIKLDWPGTDTKGTPYYDY